MKIFASALSAFLVLLNIYPCHALIPRQSLVSRFNPARNASSLVTPMQVGNGNFAFGADVTGLQTFQPFNILSSWGWKNDSLPPGTTQADVDDYRGASLLNHGRPVEYDFGGPEPIQQWLIANPNRVNLGRVGLLFMDESGAVLQDVVESDLNAKSQKLDLWMGIITSTFIYAGKQVSVEVACGQDSDVIAVSIDSALVSQGKLGIFLDFPWNDGSSKFSAPFVGNFSVPDMHTTTLSVASAKYAGPAQVQAEIAHTMDAATFYTSLAGDDITINRPSPVEHRYNVKPTLKRSSTLSVSVAYGTVSTMGKFISSTADIFQSSASTWDEYWSSSGFVDVLTGSTDSRAAELQRRIILSRYLMRVNDAGDTPPQEVSFVN